jgi:hypothetical protein
MRKDKINKEGYWEITLTPLKIPQNRIKKWLFWNIYWRVWYIWKPFFLSRFYRILVLTINPFVKRLEKYI